MSETITVTGIVATDPRVVRTAESLEITSFRLGSSQRRFNKTSGSWEYAESNWYTVTAFRRLARNAAASLRRGDRVVVSGRLRVADWKNETKSGTNVEIDADSLGHDLNWGTSTFVRSPKPEVGDSAHPRAESGSPSSAEPAKDAFPGAPLGRGRGDVSSEAPASSREPQTREPQTREPQTREP